MSANYVPYWEKLKDPRWQKRRLEVMHRDDFTCVDCGDDGSTLNVHHCFYYKGLSPWDYPIETLKTICESCHKRRHDLDLDLGIALCFLTVGGIRAVIKHADRLAPSTTVFEAARRDQIALHT